MYLSNYQTLLLLKEVWLQNANIQQIFYIPCVNLAQPVFFFCNFAQRLPRNGLFTAADST